MGGPVGLDYPAVLTFASLGGPLDHQTAALFQEVLPNVEGLVLEGLRKDDE